MSSINEMNSETSESELSDTLNTTAFDTITHATAGTLPNEETTSDFVEINGKSYLTINRTANQRTGSKPSWIWDHGRELRLLASQNPQKCWQCTYCGKIMPVHSTTYHAGDHLSKNHQVSKPGSVPEERDAPGNIANQLTNMAYKALVTNVQIDRFRYLLVRWIVCMHVALSVIEHPTFRELMLYCCPAIEPFFVKTGTTIRRWIFMEFKKQRIRMKDELAQARSLIHISFDLWTSPNSLGMVAVVAHFLDRNLKNQSLLIGVRRVKGSHSGENIAEVIIPVLVEMEIVSKLGYFTTDNHCVNDLTIELILKHLRPDITHPRERRVRCLGHIINLAAKAFLFGGDKDSFEDVHISSAVPVTALEAEMAFWRTKGPLGKLHNLIVYIRKTSQRRDAFQACCQAVKVEDDEFEGKLTKKLNSPPSWHAG
jgi:hypothetical protein